MDFNQELAKRTEIAEQIVRQFLPKADGFQKTLNESVDYSITVGGKRLRPIIMRETYELLGGQGKCIEYFMAALEMIHSGSLVHDDLPCMDNDEYRRGKHTTWYLYHEDMATLAGDDLFIFPFAVASDALKTGENPELILKAINILAKKSAHDGMIGGQSVDVEYTDQPLTREQLDFVYRLKTGALLEAAMMIGAVLAGADDETIARVEAIAANVGMAFQIRDDILDLISTTEELGKPVMSDVKNNKTTYVTLYGMEAAKQKVESCTEDAMRELRAIVGEDTFLEQLFKSMISRKK